MPPEFFPALAERLAHAALGLFAQATVVAGLALLALRTTARRNPAVRHAVALAAVICLTSSPALASGLESPVTGATWPGQGVWPLAILFGLGVWLAGSVWLLARWVSGSRAASRLRRGAIPLDGDLHAVALAATREALGAQGLPPILLSPHVQEPLALGPWRAAVLLPAFLPERLSPEEFRDVLVHECAHLRQRHHLSALAEALVGMLFWPHPLVRRVCRELAAAREEVCDNFVLRGGSPTRYARTLLALAEARHDTDPSEPVETDSVRKARSVHQGLQWVRVPMMRRRGALRRRVEGLLDRGRPRDTRCGRRQAPVLAFTCGVLVVSMTGVGMAANQPTGHPNLSSPAVRQEQRAFSGVQAVREGSEHRDLGARLPVERSGRGER